MHNEVWGRAKISPIVPLILQWFIDKIYRILCLSMLGTSGGALLMNYSNCLTLGHRDFCENGYCIWRKQRSSSDIFMFSNLILPQRDKKKKEKKKLINCLLSATSSFDLSEQFLLHCLQQVRPKVPRMKQDFVFQWDLKAQKESVGHFTSFSANHGRF